MILSILNGALVALACALILWMFLRRVAASRAARERRKWEGSRVVCGIIVRADGARFHEVRGAWYRVTPGGSPAGEKPEASRLESAFCAAVMDGHRMRQNLNSLN